VCSKSCIRNRLLTLHALGGSAAGCGRSGTAHCWFPWPHMVDLYLRLLILLLGLMTCQVYC